LTEINGPDRAAPSCGSRGSGVPTHPRLEQKKIDRHNKRNRDEKKS